MAIAPENIRIDHARDSHAIHSFGTTNLFRPLVILTLNAVHTSIFFYRGTYELAQLNFDPTLNCMILFNDGFVISRCRNGELF